MQLEQRRQAMLQLHLSDQQIYCLLRCNLYLMFDSNLLCSIYKTRLSILTMRVKFVHVIYFQYTWNLIAVLVLLEFFLISCIVWALADWYPDIMFEGNRPRIWYWIQSVSCDFDVIEWNLPEQLEANPNGPLSCSVVLKKYDCDYYTPHSTNLKGGILVSPWKQSCRCACQILKQWEDLNYQSFVFDTSRNLTIRWLIRYWNRVL